MNDIRDMRFFWGYNMQMQLKFVAQVILKLYNNLKVPCDLELTTNDIKAITPNMNTGLRNYKQEYE